MDAAEWDRRYAESGFLWSAGPNRFVEQELRALPPGRGLDLACGEGRNAVWLAESGWTMKGVDFSQVALDKAQKLAADRGVNVDWEEADVLQYTPESNAYDLVLVIYLHLQWEQIAQVLREAETALKSGGTFLLVGHDRTNLDSGYGGPPDPTVLYSEQDVAGALQHVTVEKAEKVTRAVATDSGTKHAIDCLVRGSKR